MAQEYDAVTTLLWVCGTDTKITSKEDFFLNVLSKFTYFGPFFRYLYTKYGFTSQKVCEFKYTIDNPSNLTQSSEIYIGVHTLQIQK